MLFNSLEFAIFLPIVFLLYWFPARSNLRLQNLLLLVASYVFYGWWDWRFLSLIAFSSTVDYLVGLALWRTGRPGTRRALLVLSLVVNLGLLGFFKYYGFFVDSFVTAFASIGIQLQPTTLRIILPVGISFYTFQTLSYTIDVFRRRFRPTHDPIGFFAFVSFFPQLVAGPIERATNLLPQFEHPRSFDERNAIDGLRQILLGLFKKIVIADGCGLLVDEVFGSYEQMDAASLLLGLVYFAFQIYADFSGYSDVAIGTAKLFGFRLMRNFAFPYFSRDIAEFWRRWHISLSTWFRDYVFIPLGGSRGTTLRTFFNVLVTFTVSGFWHGANWTFVAWGFLNGLFYAPLLFLGLQGAHRGEIAGQGRVWPSVTELAQIAVTFLLTLVAWTFFRATSVEQAVSYLTRMLSPEVLAIPGVAKRQLGWIGLLVVFEWFQRHKEHAMQVEGFPLVARWALYWAMAFTTLTYFQRETSFIYFQF